MKVPFFRLKFGPTEKKAVLETIQTGWVTTGPKTRRFEEEIAKIAGTKYAVAVSSCTAGIHLVLKSLNIGPGDEIITSPFTMVASMASILHCGAEPVPVDIDPVTLNIDPHSVEKKITRKTRAVIPVDYAGWPCEYNQLKKIARKHKLHLIDDAAHALGAKYRGKFIGSVADAAVFSFYSTKNITSGEGGMVATNSRRLAERVRHLSLHAMTSSGWKRYSGGSWRYDITDLGYKANMSDLLAALALGQLGRFEKMQEKRRLLAQRYLKNLNAFDKYIEAPYNDSDSVHAWHLFVIKLNLSRWRIGRDRLIAELEKRGVGCGVHFIPLYRFSYFKKILKPGPSDFPNCEKTFKRVITLPLYPDLTFKEVDYICDTIARLIRRFGR